MAVPVFALISSFFLHSLFLHLPSSPGLGPCRATGIWATPSAQGILGSTCLYPKVPVVLELKLDLVAWFFSLHKLSGPSFKKLSFLLIDWCWCWGHTWQWLGFISRTALKVHSSQDQRFLCGARDQTRAHHSQAGTLPTVLAGGSDDIFPRACGSTLGSQPVVALIPLGGICLCSDISVTELLECSRNLNFLSVFRLYSLTGAFFGLFCLLVCFLGY